MLIQRILAYWDIFISKLFGLKLIYHGGNQCAYLVNVGSTVAIVGADKKIHTIMSYFAVRHYYKNGRLVRRIPVRRDLQRGDRLATPVEIDDYIDASIALRASLAVGIIPT